MVNMSYCRFRNTVNNLLKPRRFEKIIFVRPPFDKRNDDPHKNYGIGSLQLWFILKKGENAVQVNLSTNSYLQSTIKEYRTKHPRFMIEDSSDYQGYSCYDVGYHASKPQYKGQEPMECNILKKGKCYYDGSSLRGRTDEVAKHFVEEGEKWIWKYLEKEFELRFGGLK